MITQEELKKLNENIPERMTREEAIDVLKKLVETIPEEKIRQEAAIVLKKLSEDGFGIQITREEVISVFNRLRDNLPDMTCEEAIVEMDKLRDSISARDAEAERKAKAEGQWVYGTLDGNRNIERVVMMEILTEAAKLQAIIDGDLSLNS